MALLPEFTRVVDATVLKWLSGENLPTGETMIRLRTFLEVAGYELEEALQLNELVRDLSSCIGFGVVDVDETRQRLGYRNNNAVFDLVLRAGGLSTDRIQGLRKIIDMVRKDLDVARAEWQERLHSVRTLSNEGSSSFREARESLVDSSDAHDIPSVAVLNYTVNVLRGIATLLSNADVALSEDDRFQAWRMIEALVENDGAELAAALRRIVESPS
jgi:hypothetical protein